MNRRKLIVLSCALIIGLGTMMIMKSALSPKNNNSAGPEVLVAAADIPAGQFLQAQNARWQPWAKQLVTEAFITKNGKSAKNIKGEPTNPNDFVGAVVRSGIRAGEPILKGQIVKPQERGFLSAVLDAGKRAVAAPITNVTGIAGFVFPGDRVDLILTHMMRSDENGKAAQRRASVTVVRDVRVLALDQNTNDQASLPKVAKVVTLEVDPKQAEVVTLALQIGTLSLSLRSIAENDSKENLAQPIGYGQERAFTLDSDVSHLIPAPREKELISNQVVQVLRGKQRDSESFSDKKDNQDENARDETAENPEAGQ